MTLARWHKPNLSLDTPFEHLTHLREEMQRLFESPWSGLARGFNEWAPAVDIYEDKDNVVVKAELPGMKKEDIEVSLHAGTLTVSGERKFERKKDESETYRSERFHGRFQRSVLLPSQVQADKVNASYRDGILTVTLPKSEESKPKQIAVKLN